MTDNNWREVTFGDVFEISSSKRVLQKDWQKNGIPFYRAREIVKLSRHGEVDNDLFITPELFDEYSEKYGAPKPGDIMVSAVGTLGACYIVQPKDKFYFKDASVLQFSPKDSVDVRFIKHAFETYEIRDQINAGSGSTVGTYTISRAKETRIKLPPVNEQKRLAAILDQADALRQHRKCSIARLKNLSHSIFHEMFGHPVHNERKWKIEKLGDLTTKISSGSTPKGGNKNYVDQGIVFLRSQNVWRNRIELDDVVYIDDATHEKMKKSSLKHGDILITKTGRINTENSSLGRAAMFLGEDDSANVNGHVYLVRPKPDVLKEFVLYIMTTPEYREYIRSVCVGGIDKRQINKEHLEEFPIIYPPIDEQKKFLKKLKIIEEQKARFNEQLKLAENLFLSLQQRAFRGEL